MYCYHSYHCIAVACRVKRFLFFSNCSDIPFSCFSTPFLPFPHDNFSNLFLTYLSMFFFAFLLFAFSIDAPTGSYNQTIVDSGTTLLLFEQRAFQSLINYFQASVCPKLPAEIRVCMYVRMCAASAYVNDETKRNEKNYIYVIFVF